MAMPLWDESPFKLPRWPVVTWGIIAANVLLFVGEFGAPPALIDAFAAHPAFVTDHAPAERRAALRHACHLYVSAQRRAAFFGNMLFLWIIGDDAEEAMGPLRYLFFYLGCGVMAALAFTFTALQSEASPIGASGAIAGVLGGYLMFCPCQKVAVFLPLFILWFFVHPVVRLDAYWVIGASITMQLWAISVQSHDGVAYMAHVGGFAAGLALFPLLRQRHVRLFKRLRGLPGGPWGSNPQSRVRRSINIDRPLARPLASARFR